MQKEKILIGVCTYNRPKMLEECLTSLAKQDIPPNTEITFCIADNNSDSKHNIESITKQTLNQLSYKYLFVQARGISFARNAILECAIETNSDFIIFIDDDEYADANWVQNLHNKIKNSDADVVQGKVINILPENTPPLIKQAWVTEHEEDTPLKHVATNNVIFNKKLINEWNLRFREELALTGGEDLDFFLRAKNHGSKLIYTNTAIVRETVPQERATLLWQLKRKKQDGFAISYVTYLNYGKFRVFRKYIVKSIKNLITAPFYVCFGILRANEKLRFKGLQKIFHAFGCLSFAFKAQLKSYKTTTGS